MRKLLEEFQDVFAGEQDSRPKPFAAEPVELKFVENPKPQSVPEPRWTYAQKQILTSWAEEGLRNKSLELSTSRWASRPHIVMKTPSGCEEMQAEGVWIQQDGEHPDLKDSCLTCQTAWRKLSG